MRIAFFYPSTLLSFYKKENDFRCSGSLGREEVQTHQGWAGHSAESAQSILKHAQYTLQFLLSSLQTVCTWHVHTTKGEPTKMTPAELSDSAEYH